MSGLVGKREDWFSRHAAHTIKTANNKDSDQTVIIVALNNFFKTKENIHKKDKRTNGPVNAHLTSGPRISI